jgi:hypothetical protein
MRGFLAVARREIAERRGVFAVAAAASLLPFLAPLLPAARRFGAAEARLSTAAFFAVAFSAALSLLLGATAIGRDITQGRLGFYFSRPIGNNAVWAGKLAGVWLLVVLVAFVILLPAGLYDFGAWTREARAGLVPGLLAVFGFAAVFFLGLGNAVSLALRSRPAWVAGDFVALVVWTGLMGAIALPLAAARAPLLLERIALGVAVSCAAALLASGAAQVAAGRLDAARGNRARFLTLWGLLFALAGLTFGAVRWLRSPSPRDLRVWIGSVAPAGSWIEVEGRARWRVDLLSSLLFDVASGRIIRTGGRGSGSAVISRNGSVAAWTEPSVLRPEGEQEVWTCRLEPGAAPVRTSIAARNGRIAISDDGSRLAAAADTTLGVYEIPSGRLKGSIALDEDERFTRFVFVGPERLRLYRIPSFGAARAGETLATIEIADYDPASRRVTRSASVPNVHRPFGLTFDDHGGRLLVWERGSSLSLFDVSDGRLVAVLGNFGWDATSRAFLSDGRIAVGEASGGVARIHLFSRQGEPGRVFPAGAAGLVSLGGEVSADTLAVALGPAPSVWGASDSYLLDLRSGRLRNVARHVEPVAVHLRWRLPRPEPGSVASRLFSRNDGALLLLDPATGKLTTLFRGE